MNITKTPITNIKPFLPSTLKLNEADPQNPLIPGFSKKTLEIFYKMNPENHKTRTLIYADSVVDHEIQTLDQLANTLKSAEKHDKRDKILALLGVAMCVAICAAGLAGIGLAVAFPASLFFLMPILCLSTAPVFLCLACIILEFTLDALPKAKNDLNNQLDLNSHVFTDYQINLQQYLIDHEITLQTNLKKAIQEKQREIDDLVGFQALREAKENEIADLTSAIQQLNDLVAFYLEEDNNPIALTA